MSQPVKAAFAFLLCVPVLVGCAIDRPPRLVLATTTSVGNAGLLEKLLPAYERDHHVRFGVHLAGSGRALEMLASGNANVVITHAPDTEAAALMQHPDWSYRKIMFNDFLIVGPPADPADVSSAASLDDALKRIAQSPVGLVSRADQSGTHERERALWAAVGVTPVKTLPTGQGMAMTLRITAERQAYTLTDRATWLNFETSLPLVPLAQGDQRLLNTYAVIVGDQERERGSEFAQWLAEGSARDIISTVPGFTVWPLDQPRSHPDDRPR
jgi:tungstate transport system substrate-binding protein